MELLVISNFRDKFNPSKLYKEGDVISFDDLARCQDLIKRGLCKAVEMPFEECEMEGAEAEAEAEAEATEPQEVATPQEPAKEPKNKPAPAKKKNSKK